MLCLQKIHTQRAVVLRQGALSERSLRRLPDRERLQGGHHHRRKQIQPEKLLVLTTLAPPPPLPYNTHLANLRRRNGRWRSLYIFDPSSEALEGTIKVDVHYYEDGNVRLLTDKPVSASVPSGTGAGIVKEISASEKKYQEELNRSFTSLSEGAFKALRRQLPVTRQKIEWDKVASYRLGQDIGGGSSRR